jgi:hypothetical protein
MVSTNIETLYINENQYLQSLVFEKLAALHPASWEARLWQRQIED